MATSTAKGDRLVVRTPDEDLVATTVVVASGAKNRPLLPVLAGQLTPSVASLHVADYRPAGDLAEGGVLVVGGGQSGAQVAEDLVHAGRRVWLTTSQVGRNPSHFRGRERLAWHVECGWWAQTPRQLPDPAAMWLRTPLLASNGRGTGLPALRFVGMPWQSTRASAILHGMPLDIQHAVAGVITQLG